jgi:hypothetical protein
LVARAGMSEPLQWYDANAKDNPPWIKALAEVRLLAPREGCCYEHVQAVIVSIDQYAGSAFGNRDYFLNRPYGVGGSRKDNLPNRTGIAPALAAKKVLGLGAARAQPRRLPDHRTNPEDGT